MSVALVELPAQHASAAPGDFRLALSQDSATSRIGTPLTLTATLSQDDGDGGTTQLSSKSEPLVVRKAFCQMVDSEHQFVCHGEHPQFAMISTHGRRAQASHMPDPGQHPEPKSP